MSMIFHREQTLYIILLLILLIASPVLAIICCAGLLLFWLAGGVRQENGAATMRFVYFRNTRIWLIAGVLTLLSMAIYQTAQYSIQFGFPTTVITYYPYPEPADLTVSIWSKLVSGFAINPLQGVINATTYYVVLNPVNTWWLRRQNYTGTA